MGERGRAERDKFDSIYEGSLGIKTVYTPNSGFFMQFSKRSCSYMKL
jgi:hypothetical protein